MGKVAFFSFCTVAFLAVLMIDFNQQRGMHDGVFGPSQYIISIKERMGLPTAPAAAPQPAENQSPATEEPATRPVSYDQLKQAVSGSGSGAAKAVFGLLGGSESGPADTPADQPAAGASPEEVPPVTINRPSKKSGCGGGSFCGVSN